MKVMNQPVGKQSIKPRILSPRAVSELTGLSRTTIWRQGRSGEFPRPVQVSPGRVGFLVEEVEAWIAGKRDQRDGGSGPAPGSRPAWRDQPY